MRKLANILIAFVMIFSLCACNDNPQGSNSNTTPPNGTGDNTMDGQKVARVVLLLGQSNMEGMSYTKFLLDNGVSQTKYDEYSAGYSNVKISYKLPAQSSDNRFVPTTLGIGVQKDRFGPEVGIAEYLTEHGYESVFLVKCAIGGTSLNVEWRSPSSGGAVGFLYKEAVEYSLNAMKALESMGYYPVIDAVCWMQGESDSNSTIDYANKYYDLQQNFINDLRNAFAAYGNINGIGFVDAGISSCVYWTYRDIINEAKFALSQEMKLVSYFSTIDERLEYQYEPSFGADNAHYDCLSEIKLGHLFGEYLTIYLNRDIVRK